MDKDSIMVKSFDMQYQAPQEFYDALGVVVGEYDRFKTALDGNLETISYFRTFGNKKFLITIKEAN